MYLEDKENVSLFRFFSSFIILALVLFAFYKIKGQLENPSPKSRLVQLRQIDTKAKIVNYKMPLFETVVTGWKNLSRLDFVTAYQALIAILYSLLLHLIFLGFEREKWKLNHHLLLYICAFLPFNVYVPYEYAAEIFCSVWIYILILFCHMETLFDLILLLVLTLLGLLSSFLMFLIAFTFFVIILSFTKMKQDKAKTAVFYKKKSIAGKFLLAYLFIFFVGLILGGVYDVFGENSFHFFFSNAGAILYQFVPIVLILFVSVFLMKSEKELSSVPAIIVFLILLLVSLFFASRKDSPLKSTAEKPSVQLQVSPKNEKS